MRHDLSDVTFIIPARIDSLARYDNLCTVATYLHTHFDTNILVVECDSEPKIPENDHLWEKAFLPGGEHFHRTRVLNFGFRAADTPIVVNYDTDVLFSVQAYLDARKLLEDPSVVFAFPYDGHFYDVGDLGRETVKSTQSVDSFRRESSKWVHNNSLGGGIFADKAKYREIGYENEAFVNWGWEDDERIHRAHKLGYSFRRVANSTLWHLPHPRGGSKWYTGPNSTPELSRIANMSPEALRAEVETWPWRG